jgi:tRNA (guanine26-N2/guanine27-N2)-dimethyltransferase
MATQPEHCWLKSKREYTRQDIAKQTRHKIDFTPHADVSKFEKGEKVVFYQVNPLPNWGPASRAITIKKDSKSMDSGTADDGKRKAEEPVEQNEGSEAKKAKVDEPVTTTVGVEEEDSMNL